jgi:hypothetical protein
MSLYYAISNNPGEEDQLGAAWFASVLKQNPKLVDRFAWTSRLDPNSKKLLERADRETFSHVCRKHDVSEIEAHFKLLVEVLGAGFSEYAAAQAIQSNAVSLSPATPAELTKWRVEPEGAANNAALLGQKTTTVKTHTAKNEHRRQPQPSAVSKRCLPSALLFQRALVLAC